MILSGAVSCLPSCTEPFFIFFHLTQFLIFLGINYKPSMCIMACKKYSWSYISKYQTPIEFLVACLVSNLSTLTYIYLSTNQGVMYCLLKSLFLLFSFPFLLLYLTSAPAREKYKFQGSNFTSVGDSWFSFFPFSLSIFCAVFCFLYFFSFF